MNKILIKLYVPLMEKQYDVWIPINENVFCIIKFLIKGIEQLNKLQYNTEIFPKLYNKATAEAYNYSDLVVNTDIRNGAELILF